jgi:hypothetical protein
VHSILGTQFTEFGLAGAVGVDGGGVVGLELVHQERAAGGEIAEQLDAAHRQASLGLESMPVVSAVGGHGKRQDRDQRPAGIADERLPVGHVAVQGEAGAEAHGPAC